MNYYKATRPNGTDFRTGTIDYAAALASGEVIRHPSEPIRDDPSTYLSVSVEPADCTGMAWPCRLFRVEPVGRVIGSAKNPLQASRTKRAVSALRVVEELPAWQALGPNGQEVASLIERAGRLTADEARRLAAAWDAAWDAAGAAAWDARRDAARGAVWDAAEAAAWDAARDAAWAAAEAAAWDAAEAAAWDAAEAAGDAARAAAWDAARAAAWAAAEDAARALLVRDRISKQHFDTLYGPWREVIA